MTKDPCLKLSVLGVKKAGVKEKNEVVCRKRRSALCFLPVNSNFVLRVGRERFFAFYPELNLIAFLPEMTLPDRSAILRNRKGRTLSVFRRRHDTKFVDIVGFARKTVKSGNIVFNNGESDLLYCVVGCDL